MTDKIRPAEQEPLRLFIERHFSSLDIKASADIIDSRHVTEIGDNALKARAIDVQGQEVMARASIEVAKINQTPVLEETKRHRTTVIAILCVDAASVALVLAGKLPSDTLGWLLLVTVMVFAGNDSLEKIFKGIKTLAGR